MSRSLFALCFFAVSFAAAGSLHGQVAPSATERSLTVRAGAFASVFQPDYYAPWGVEGTSPNRIYGPGAYVDIHVSRWIQPEVEMRWLRFNAQYGVDQDTYSIGERLPIVNFHKFTPYGKFLVGLGHGSWLTGNALVLSYGGGVDYRLSRRFTLRAADLEYQRWFVSSPLIGDFAVKPYGVSAGMSYRVF